MNLGFIQNYMILKLLLIRNLNHIRCNIKLQNWIQKLKKVFLVIKKIFNKLRRKHIKKRFDFIIISNLKFMII